MKWEMEILSTSPYISQANWLVEENRNTNWTPAENKRFENALAVYDVDTPDRWHKVAAMIPGKTVGDVIKQYQELEADVSDIEAGLVPLPGYSNSANSPFSFGWVNSSGYGGFKGLGTKRSSSGRTPEQERKKGVPWTEEEHKLFLLGLKMYGKGDWRNISRNFVITRTPTQVASHAQKYFIRQLSGGKDRRRASIHDITTVNLTDTTRTVICSSSSSPDNRKRSGSPQQHQPNFISGTTQRARFQWTQANAIALNDNGHEKMLLSPYGITRHSQNMHRSALHHESSYLGPQAPNMVFQMQSTQGYYCHA